MALLKSNPDAFIDNNVHRLKVGHVLRIDDPTVLTSISRKEAANSFVEQTDSWNSYRQQAPVLREPGHDSGCRGEPYVYFFLVRS